MEINLEEFIPKWIEALESGKYKQTTCVMKMKEKDETFSYCCLGVACEILGLETVPGYVSTSNKENCETFQGENINQPSYLTLKYLLGDRNCENYIEMNDIHASFTEIAKEIRKDFKFYSE